MNKNDEGQYIIFKELIEKNNKDPRDLFFEAFEIIKAEEPYDAIVKFKNNVKHVQVTTMSNLVAGTNQKSFHAPRISSYPKFNSNKKVFDKKAINKNINHLKKNNIKRKISSNKKTLHFQDEYKHFLPNEVNLDNKI